MSVTALIVAAGRGTRAGGDLPKQYQCIAGRSVLDWTLDAMASHPAVTQLVVVTHPDDSILFSELENAAHPALLRVDGGATRGASVMAGLAVSTAARVLVHDGARPLIGHALIDRVLAALDNAAGAAPALAVTDALWRGAQGKVTGTQDRGGLYRAQTPQGFHTAALRRAYAADDGAAADDVAVARAAGLDVAIVPGDEANLKVTGPGDFARAEALLKDRSMDIRVGQGFDVHAFCEGDHVVLCGVRVAHDKALRGHSDADVGMHAATDAIYGALADGDIGQHFPPSDPRWKGAESHIFLTHAVSRAAARGFAISNIDVTLICEHPKIGPHAAAMRVTMAEIMGIEADRVSVKATTSEKLGFPGRGEGIAALASATLVKT
ncbi:MAG: bifunctional 2-C-methyl-D-erythritol 4-phosphate cytidylyltransferase/2-C-methyl-D-erythritol 2,4-cyclodiphosphate synthase [Brevirhabdus sp.]